MQTIPFGFIIALPLSIHPQSHQISSAKNYELFPIQQPSCRGVRHPSKGVLFVSTKGQSLRYVSTSPAHDFHPALFTPPKRFKHQFWHLSTVCITSFSWRHLHSSLFELLGPTVYTIAALPPTFRSFKFTYKSRLLLAWSGSGERGALLLFSVPLCKREKSLKQTWQQSLWLVFVRGFWCEVTQSNLTRRNPLTAAYALLSFASRPVMHLCLFSSPIFLQQLCLRKPWVKCLTLTFSLSVYLSLSQLDNLNWKLLFFTPQISRILQHSPGMAYLQRQMTVQLTWSSCSLTLCTLLSKSIKRSEALQASDATLNASMHTYIQTYPTGSTFSAQ